jgi:hypothetical protein
MIDFEEVFPSRNKSPGRPGGDEELTASMGLRWGQHHHIEMTTWVPCQGYRDLDVTSCIR